VLVNMGNNTPVSSMEASGKVIFAKHNGVSTVNVKMAPNYLTNGESLSLAAQKPGVL